MTWWSAIGIVLVAVACDQINRAFYRRRRRTLQQEAIALNDLMARCDRALSFREFVLKQTATSAWRNN